MVMAIKGGCEPNIPCKLIEKMGIDLRGGGKIMLKG